MTTRILIVEDDTSLALLLRDNFEYEGFIVDCAAEGREAIDKSRAQRPDLVLLDVMLPGLDGFKVCRALSAPPTRLPIIMLTSRVQQQDKILGLELGADDYVTKPFVFKELLARVQAVLRRTRRTQHILALGSVTVDLGRLKATRDGVDLALTSREFAMLQNLAEHPGRIVNREELLRAVWRYREIPLTRSVDVAVARLRRKIEADPEHPRFLRTVHGDGYCLVLND